MSALCLTLVGQDINMVSLQPGSHTVTCTPHFKNDADRPWITQEGVGIISISLHPKSDITLEDVAKLIENFASRQVTDQRATQPAAIQAMNIQFRNTVYNMTFRGEIIQRAQMVNYRAVDYMRDGEPFNLLYNFTATVKPWMLFCSCCIVCFGLCCKSSAEPQAQGTSHSSTAEYD